MNAKLSKMSSVIVVTLRCVSNRTRGSSLSSSVLRIALDVLSKRLHVRSGSAAVTGKVARICCRILIFGRVSACQACEALTAVFILAASSQLVHLCFQIVNLQRIPYSAGSSSDFRAHFNGMFQIVEVTCLELRNQPRRRQHPLESEANTTSQMVTESIK